MSKTSSKSSNSKAAKLKQAASKHSVPKKATQVSTTNLVSLNSGANPLNPPFVEYSQSEKLVELGKVVGVWGVKGWIKIHSYTRERQGIGKYKQWILQPAGKPLGSNQVSVEIEICRVQGKSVVAKIANLSDRNIAESLNGYKIFIESSQLPPLPRGQYYWSQLVGLSVVNQSGAELGKVIDMMETGANDVFVVEDQVQDDSGESQSIERLIPQTDSVVIKVDMDEQVLTVDWEKDYLV